MKRSDFEAIVETNNAVPITRDLILFSDLELYSFSTGKSILFGDFQSLYEHDLPDGETFGDLVDRTDAFEFSFDGGRGASSGMMGGGFNHASDSGRGEGTGRTRYPSELNIGGRYQDYNGTLKAFSDRYKSADHEFGITVNSEGFVTQHIEGGKSSVRIASFNNETVIHNHPNGSNFSDTDLISTASSRSSGIVAVGSQNTYTMAKGKNFDSKGFIKAVKSAQWPAQYDYNKGADWWLSKNQKKYGYTYSRKKTA